MRRRHFIATSGGTLAAWPLASAGQQRERPRVVGILLESSTLAEMAGADPLSLTARGLVHGLRDLGWLEGRNIIIERRSTENRRDRAPEIMEELIGRKVELIMVSGAPWLLDAAREATSTIPIVAWFSHGIDPAALGQVASLARPGGNLTGVLGTTGVDFGRKRLQFLKELAPATRRIAWLGTEQQRELHPPDAGPPGTRLVHAVAQTLDQFDEAFAVILREGCDAVHVGGAGVHLVHRAQIIAFTAKHNLPASYPFREAVVEGGLMAYGPPILHHFSLMAGLADRILRGASPADLPIALPDRFDFVINRKTANALGLTIPLSLEGAAEVIE